MEKLFPILSSLWGLSTIVLLGSFFILPTTYSYLLVIVSLGAVLSLFVNIRFVLLFALLPLSRTGFGIVPDHPGFGIFDLYGLWVILLFFLRYVTYGFSTSKFPFPILASLVMLVSFLPGVIQTASFEYTFRFGSVFLINVATLFAVYYYLHRFDQKKLHLLLNIVVVATVILAFYGLYLSATASSVFRTLISRNANELTGDPNHYAAYIIMIMCLAIGMALNAKERLYKALYLSAAGVFFIATLLTISRAGYITLVFALFLFGLYMYFQLGVKRIMLAIVTFGIVGMVATILTTDIASKFVNLMALSDRLESAVSGEDGSVNQRTKILTVAFRVVSDNPVIGVGYGNFEPIFNKYRTGHLSTGDSRVVHNMYVTILAENGIVGFTGALIFYGSLLWFLWSRFRSAKRLEDKTILYSIMAALLSFFVIGLTLELFNEAFFWIFSATAISYAQVIHQQQDPAQLNEPSQS